jgi:hypothetical protein
MPSKGMPPSVKNASPNLSVSPKKTARMIALAKQVRPCDFSVCRVDILYQVGGWGQGGVTEVSFERGKVDSVFGM